MGSPFFARALFDQRAIAWKAKSRATLVGNGRPGVLQNLRHAAVRLAEKSGCGGDRLATFDDRNAFAPTEHICVSDKIGWVRLDDGLPQYQELVPGSAGMLG